MSHRKEIFQSTSIYNRSACQPRNDPYPCINRDLAPSLEYAGTNPNYDLYRLTYDWEPNQTVPDLLLPHLQQYKEQSGREKMLC